VQQIELLRLVLEVLDRLQIAYAIVGSYASGVWGEPRMTLDIDLVVQLEQHHSEQLLDAFPEDFYLNRSAIDQAIAEAGQFNLIHPRSGNKVDFMVLAHHGVTPPQIARRIEVQLLPDCHAYVAAPDDVIIAKMRYYLDGSSDKHLRDITGILKRSGDSVDREYVAVWAAEHGALQLWEELQTRASG
jgi:predicted nucleotidyltransferase